MHRAVAGKCVVLTIRGERSQHGRTEFIFQRMGIEHQRQIMVRALRSWIDCDCTTYQCLGTMKLAPLIGDDALHVQNVEIVRIERQRRRIEPIGFAILAVLLVCESRVHQFEQGGRKAALGADRPQSAMTLLVALAAAAGTGVVSSDGHDENELRKAVFYAINKIAALMLNLSRVTLCCVDCVNHDLALAAIGQCVQKCEFGRVLLVTDRAFDLAGVDVLRIAPLASREAYSHFVIKELAQHIRTEFVLMVQWDGFVINPAAWSDEFLEFDYIGAKWGWPTDGHTVGNGGFSLRSKRLLDALADPHVAEFPIEDEAICRHYRSYLEATHGIRFAPETVADQFSFEASYPKGLPFGFHGLFNFWLFFQKPDIAAFLEMTTPAILGSPQCMQLAKNLAELKRTAESAMVANRILGAHPSHAEAAGLLGRLTIPAPATPAVAAVKPVGRNDPCPCGSGKRYKACHGALG
jgi:hypothetical protein